jgi:acetyltransferase-like isoleucine patch superfamily enzyme
VNQNKIMIPIIFKAFRKSYFIIIDFFYNPIAKIQFLLNGVNYKSNLKVKGLLKVIVTRRGSVHIGNNCKINSGPNNNIIGRQQKTIFWIDGNLKIGNNVGVSATAIICNHEIEIGDFVTIGGNTVIYDTDFHSLDPNIRKDKTIDKKNAKYGKVTIHENVFIGAHTTILKGVTIGKNSIIGACSTVVSEIPENEIWAGNPAKFIKKI